MLGVIIVFAIFAACSVKPAASVPDPGTSKTVAGNTAVNSQFAFSIFKQLNAEDKNGNIFISPLSISAALTMAYEGAATTTKDAMAKTLGYTDLTDKTVNARWQKLIRHLNQTNAKVDINVENSIWIRKGEVINKSFITANKNIFNASVHSVDFSKDTAAAQINQWISDATKKKIEKMVSPPIPKDAIMYLINAVYFKGDWTTKFDIKDSIKTEFHSEDGSIDEAMMMKKNATFEYGQGDDFKAVRLPYGNGKLAMYCILPDAAIDINDFIADLDSGKWKTVKKSLSETENLQLQIPRFKMEYGIKNLNKSLTALGMGKAFSDTADFSGIRNDTKISRVLHKAVIEVNETGSEAAAATVTEISTTAFKEPVSFFANRPFVFIIQDDETGNILFMGKLQNM